MAGEHPLIYLESLSKVFYTEEVETHSRLGVLTQPSDFRRLPVFGLFSRPAQRSAARIRHRTRLRKYQQIFFLAAARLRARRDRRRPATAHPRLFRICALSGQSGRTAARTLFRPIQGRAILAQSAGRCHAGYAAQRQTRSLYDRKRRNSGPTPRHWAGQSG